MDALEAMPGSALAVLLFLAGVAGWIACRFYDWAACSLEDARDLTVRGARTTWRGLKRLVALGVALGVLVVVIGIAYNATH